MQCSNIQAASFTNRSACFQWLTLRFKHNFDVSDEVSSCATTELSRLGSEAKKLPEYQLRWFDVRHSANGNVLLRNPCTPTVKIVAVNLLASEKDIISFFDVTGKMCQSMKDTSVVKRKQDTVSTTYGNVNWMKS